MTNLTLKSNLDYDAPQGMQASYEAIESQNTKQDALINATSTGVGGGIRGRKKKSIKKKKMYGGETLPPYPNAAPKGYIEVQPLPAGSQTGNTQSNNIQNAQTFAESVQNADGDKYVSSGDPVQSGGKKRRRMYTNKKKKSKRRRTTKNSKNGKKRRQKTRRIRK